MISMSEMKVAIATELGDEVAAAEKSAEKEVHKWDGAKTAYKGAAKAIEGLLAHVTLDFKEDKLTHDEAKLVQLWVKRCGNVCDNLRLSAEVQEQRALGRMDAFKMTKKATLKMVVGAKRNLSNPDHKESFAEPDKVDPPRNMIDELMARNNEPPEPESAKPAKKTRARKKTAKKTAKKKAKKTAKKTS
jgi:hypothetical protein